MSTPYDPILTSVGFINASSPNNKLSNEYPLEVIKLIANGNQQGPTLLHFDANASASNLLEKSLSNKKSTAPWHGIFVDLLHNSVATSLNVAGATPLAIPTAPVFDVTSSPTLGAAPLPLPPPGGELTWSLALATTLGIVGIGPDPASIIASTLSQLVIRINAAGVITPYPAILPTFQSSYSLSSIDDMSFLNDTSIKVDGLVLPQIIDSLIKIPPKLLSQTYMSNLSQVQQVGFTYMPEIIFNSGIGEVVSIPEIQSRLQRPKEETITLKATLIVWMKNISKIISTLIVGLTVGSGNIATSMATLSGLI